MASALGNVLSIDIRVRPSPISSIAHARRRAREVGVRRAVGVREAVAEDERARRIGLEDVPAALRLVALRAGHVVLDAAAGRQVVLR